MVVYKPNGVPHRGFDFHLNVHREDIHSTCEIIDWKIFLTTSACHCVILKMGITPTRRTSMQTLGLWSKVVLILGLVYMSGCVTRLAGCTDLSDDTTAQATSPQTMRELKILCWIW